MLYILLHRGEDVSHLKPPFDRIVATEILYLPDLFPALAKTLLDLSGPNTFILLGM